MAVLNARLKESNLIYCPTDSKITTASLTIWPRVKATATWPAKYRPTTRCPLHSMFHAPVWKQGCLFETISMESWSCLRGLQRSVHHTFSLTHHPICPCEPQLVNRVSHIISHSSHMLRSTGDCVVSLIAKSPQECVGVTEKLKMLATARARGLQSCTGIKKKKNE